MAELMDDVPKYEHTPEFWERARAAIAEGFCPDGYRLHPAPDQVPADASGGICPGHNRVHWVRQFPAPSRGRTAF